MTICAKYSKTNVIYYILDSWITVAIVTAALVLKVCLKYSIQFETNDDAGIMQLLAGYRTGVPQPGSIFCWFLWGLLISSLYKINECIPWYTLVCLFVIWLSLSVILFSFIKTARTLIGKVIMYVLFGMIFLGTIFYSVVRLQFTTTSSICGCAVICLVLTTTENDDKKKKFFESFLMTFLFLVALNIRRFVGYLCLAILLAVFIYKVIKKDLRIKSAIRYAVLMTSLFLISLLSNWFYNKVSGIDRLHEYHYERSKFTDYARTPYEEGKDTYELVGWDETLFDLASSWFFMDRNINVDSFRTINQMTAKNSKDVSVVSKLKNGMLTALKTKRSRTAIVVSVITFVLYALIMARYRKYREIVMECLGVLGFCTGSGLILLLLASRGRFPMRVINMTLILCVVPCVILCFKTLQTVWIKTNGWEKLVISFDQTQGTITSIISYKISGFVTMCLVMIIILGVICSSGIQTFRGRRNCSAGISARRNVDNYVIRNHDHFYIYDPSMGYATDPFYVYPDEKPVNIIFWGGSGVYFPTYYQQLAANGYDEMFSDMFFNEDIFFIGESMPDEKLKAYMFKHFPGCQCFVVETYDDFIVYQFFK